MDLTKKNARDADLIDLVVTGANGEGGGELGRGWRRHSGGSLTLRSRRQGAALHGVDDGGDLDCFPKRWRGTDRAVTATGVLGSGRKRCLATQKNQ